VPVAPVILTTQEAEIRRITVLNQPRQIVQESLSQNTLSQKIIRLVEWLKLKAPRSSSSTTKKKKKRKKNLPI
jgi:hypothetical protein